MKHANAESFLLLASAVSYKTMKILRAMFQRMWTFGLRASMCVGALAAGHVLGLFDPDGAAGATSPKPKHPLEVLPDPSMVDLPIQGLIPNKLQQQDQVHEGQMFPLNYPIRGQNNKVPEVPLDLNVVDIPIQVLIEDKRPQQDRVHEGVVDPLDDPIQDQMKEMAGADIAGMGPIQGAKGWKMWPKT